MTASFLVGTLILLVSFGVVLLFYAELFQGDPTADTCHLSVLGRGALPQFGSATPLAEIVPLRCPTKKVCVTSGLFGRVFQDESCSSFDRDEEISSVSVGSSEEVERVLSREVVRCWEMMGEGKVSVFGGLSQSAKDIFAASTKSVPSCVICSRVSFSEPVVQQLGPSGMTSVNPYNYMLTHIYPGDNKTYYERVAGQGARVGSDQFLGSLVAIQNLTVEGSCSEQTVKTSCELKGCVWEGSPEDPSCRSRSDQEVLALEERKREEARLALEHFEQPDLAIVFSQISAPSHKDVLRNTAYAAGGVSFVTGSTYTLVSALANPPGVLTALGVLGAQHLSVAHLQSMTAGYCGDLSIGREARLGCSSVRIVEYDATALQEACIHVESLG